MRNASCLFLSTLLPAIALFTGLSASAGDLPNDLSVLKEGTRVLFQGDSITDGNRGRNQDPNHILGHGYAFILAARYGGHLPARKLTFINRGISGNKVTDLKARWQADALDLKPDVLSILVGINDAGSVVRARDPAVPPEDFERVYDELLSETKAALPGVRLVLCEPFILPVGGVKEKWDAYSADVKARQEIVARLAAKHGACLVRLQEVFDKACARAPADYWIWDGVHPTYSGHQLLAEAWARAVEAFWPRP
jgi:lysophospholipase L1-like esterase